MEEKKLTVVVPVYNVEKYLDKCIESIIRQSYLNLEVILVDDGSTDSSGKICEEWAQRDNRIVVIHKKNEGLSDARNNGINKASGDYITFVDSDDELKNNCIYEIILDKMTKNNNDIGCYNFCRIDEDSNYIENETLITEKQYFDDEKYEILSWGNIYTYAVVSWNKIYTREIFGKIKFPYGRTNEDEFVIHNILNCAKKIGIYSDLGYGYRIRKNSITNIYNKKRLDIIEALEERLDFIKMNRLPESFYNETLNIYLYNIIQHYRKIDKFYQNYDKKAIKNDLYSKFKENITKIKGIDSIRFQNRIKFIIFRCSPNIGTKLFNLFSKI